MGFGFCHNFRCRDIPNSHGTATATSVSVTMTADNCFTSYRLRAIPTGSQPQPLPIIVNGGSCETTVTRSISGLESDVEYDITVSVWSSAPANSVGDTFSITTLNQ